METAKKITTAIILLGMFYSLFGSAFAMSTSEFGNIIVWGNATFYQWVSVINVSEGNVNGSWIPAFTLMFDMGNTTNLWNNTYTYSIFANYYNWTTDGTRYLEWNNWQLRFNETALNETIVALDTDDMWDISSSRYLYNDSGTLEWNETLGNSTYVNVDGDSMTGQLSWNDLVNISDSGVSIDSSLNVSIDGAWIKKNSTCFQMCFNATTCMELGNQCG